MLAREGLELGPGYKFRVLSLAQAAATSQRSNPEQYPEHNSLPALVLRSILALDRANHPRVTVSPLRLSRDLMRKLILCPHTALRYNELWPTPDHVS